MSKKDFEKFLEEKTQKEAPKPVDWAARKRLWLGKLAEFYALTEGYLAEYIESGKIKVNTSLISLQEDHIGAYKAEKKIISIGSDKASLEPVGTLLIGASGRVDLVGPAGSVKFILTGKHSNGVKISVTIREANQPKKGLPEKKTEPPEELVWKIATPPPVVRFIELNAEMFLDALVKVVNG